MQANRRAYILRAWQRRVGLMEINGGRVEELMKRRGWSQGRLAKEADVSQPTIWAMIHNVYRSPTSVTKVAHALNVPVDLLFGSGPLPETVPERHLDMAEEAGTWQPLTVATFLDEGMAALEEAFGAEGLPYDTRDAALTVADWWIELVGELQITDSNRITDPETAAKLRAGLAREIAREVRASRRASRSRDITTSE